MNDTPSSITAPSHDPSLFLPSSSVCVAMMLILCLRFDDVASLFNLAVYCIDIEVLSTLSSCSSPKPRIEKDDNAASLPFFLSLAALYRSIDCCRIVHLLCIYVRAIVVERTVGTWQSDIQRPLFLSFFFFTNQREWKKERKRMKMGNISLSLLTRSGCRLLKNKNRVSLLVPMSRK